MTHEEIESVHIGEHVGVAVTHLCQNIQTVLCFCDFCFEIFGILSSCDIAEFLIGGALCPPPPPHPLENDFPLSENGVRE